MKAKCAGCGKRTSLDAKLLGDGEEARHADCLPDEPVDPKRVAAMLKRVGIAPRPEYEGAGPDDGPTPKSHRPGKLTITKASGVDVEAA